MRKDIYVPVFIGVLAIVIFIWVGQTIASVWLFIPATVIAFIIYLGTFYNKMPDPKELLPIYLVALAVQMLHFAEEYLTNFCVELPIILGQDPYPVGYWLTFNMTAYFVFILGGVVIFKKWKEYSIIPLFFILVGVLFNSIAHIGLAIYTGGYFSGLFTAIIYAFLAPFLIKRIFRKTDKQSKK